MMLLLQRSSAVRQQLHVVLPHWRAAGAKRTHRGAEGSPTRALLLNTIRAWIPVLTWGWSPWRPAATRDLNQKKKKKEIIPKNLLFLRFGGSKTAQTVNGETSSCSALWVGRCWALAWGVSELLQLSHSKLGGVGLPSSYLKKDNQAQVGVQHFDWSYKTSALVMFVVEVSSFLGKNSQLQRTHMQLCAFFFLLSQEKNRILIFISSSM